MCADAAFRQHPDCIYQFGEAPADAVVDAYGEETYRVGVVMAWQVLTANGLVPTASPYHDLAAAHNQPDCMDLIPVAFLAVYEAMVRSIFCKHAALIFTWPCHRWLPLVCNGI